MTAKSRVMMKSMEKTARLLLLHLSKRDPHGPMAPRIQQHVERMMRTMAETFDDAGKKRPLEEGLQHDGLDAKRQRLAGLHFPIRPLGAGPHTLGDVFTLVSNEELKTFDISQLPLGLVSRVCVKALAGIKAELLAKAVDGVRGRLVDLANAPAPELNPNTAPLGVDDDDDDDYEPDFYQAEDTEQILNKLDGASTAPEAGGLDSSLALASFKLPPPVELTAETALGAGDGTVARVLEMAKCREEPAGKRNKAGFDRLAASSGSRDGWISILARLATRSAAEVDEVAIKEEEAVEWKRSRSELLSNHIREAIYNFVMEDFRKHVDVAVSWLCEEWYNDRLRQRLSGARLGYYEGCALRLIDGFLPYLHPQDKILTRFLSEIPELNGAILSRVKHMCRDPSVVPLALTSLLYLVMMRPPVKELALDVVQDIWTECKWLCFGWWRGCPRDPSPPPPPLL